MDNGTTRSDFPVLSYANAQVSEDGDALLVEAPTFEGGVVRFALALPDVRNLVNFLLTTMSGLGRSNPGLADWLRRNALPTEPIPISSFSVSDPEAGSDALVVIGIGPTELAFSLPAAAFDPIGRAMLTASARPSPSGAA